MYIRQRLTSLYSLIALIRSSLVLSVGDVAGAVVTGPSGSVGALAEFEAYRTDTGIAVILPIGLLERLAGRAVAILIGLRAAGNLIMSAVASTI
jgi:hypothetical protein